MNLSGRTALVGAGIAGHGAYITSHSYLAVEAAATFGPSQELPPIRPAFIFQQRQPMPRADIVYIYMDVYMGAGGLKENAPMGRMSRERVQRMEQGSGCKRSRRQRRKKGTTILDR